MTPIFSVICVYNDDEVLEGWLLPSLERQNKDLFETILVDNRDGRFSSAAEALNSGAEQADGEYYMFVHQDVRLLSEDFFEEANQFLKDLPDVGVAGVSGLSTSGETMVECTQNILYQGEPPGSAENKFSPEDLIEFDESEAPIQNQYLEIESPNQLQMTGKKIEEPVQVQTIDELLMIVPSSIYSKYEFSEEICPHWHFYAVEYCLRMKYRERYQPYVLPLKVWHKSTGMTLDSQFYRTYDNIVREYSDIEAQKIYTPTGIRPLDRTYSFPRRYLPTRILAELYSTFKFVFSYEFVENVKTALDDPQRLAKYAAWKYRNFRN